MAVLLHFLDRLQDHYLWLLGLLFMIEPALDYNIERYKDWADRYLSRRIRTRIAITLSVATLFCASYLAFRDEYEATVHARNQTAVVTGERDEARRQIVAGSPASQQKTINQLQENLARTAAELAALKQSTQSRHLSDAQKGAFRNASIVKGTSSYSIKLAIPSNCVDCNEYVTCSPTCPRL